jgi:4-hydroxy-2-oxoheptanedioate aldolase
MIENRLKKKLKSGQRVFGTWSMLSSPAVMNVIGEAGLDFVIIDMEHGPMGFETAENQLYATEAAGCTPIIRLGDDSEATILRALEIGTQSLLVSHVSDADQANRIVQAARYHPEGCRGLSPFTRNHGYGDENLPAKLQRANADMFVGVLVEGEDGIRNIPEIASVPGLDMVYLGIYDISASIGIPGELDDPRVLNMLRECAAAVNKKGLVAGSVARDRNYIRVMYEAGFRFISYRVDCAILRDGFRTALGWYREIAETK